MKQFVFNPLKNNIPNNNTNNINFILPLENNDIIFYDSDNLWKNTGAFKFIKQFNFNLTGPTGSNGINGNQGPTGIDGNSYTGPKGEKGNQGYIGFSGNNKFGLTGFTGTQGSKGPQGSLLIAQGNNYSNILIYDGISDYISNGSEIINIGNNTNKSISGFNSINIGNSTGSMVKGTGSISIGLSSGFTGCLDNSISIGTSSGVSNKGLNSISIGLLSGEINQYNNTISIGSNAGRSNLNFQSIVIGSSAGLVGTNENNVLIGNSAGSNNRGGNNLICIGFQSGFSGFLGSGNSINLGSQTARTNQGTGCIAIGFSSCGGGSATPQFTGSISIGTSSSLFGCRQECINIGVNAGGSNPGEKCIFIGTSAGYFTTNSSNVIAIGNLVQQAITAAQSRTITIGTVSGYIGQRSNSISIGNAAGQTSQGAFSIAIGTSSGFNNLPNNTIVISSSNVNLNPAASGFYVNYLKNISAGTSNGMAYNPTTKEIFYHSTKTFVIDHPLDQNKYLVHACLEGPEAGVYYRGKAEIKENQEYTEIELPDYVEKLATDFTIKITSIGNIPKFIYSSEIENNKFKVYGEKGWFYWLIFGLRKKINIEIEKSNTNIKGDGPYKYI